MNSPGDALHIPPARQYGRQRLDRPDLDSDPFLQFDRWFVEGSPTVLEPGAMALATADRSGHPSLRMVLLKEVNPTGFLFGTNYESRKGLEISENPTAALLFYWPALERQARIVGRIEKATPQESDAIFMARPLGSRLAARISRQSAVAESRELLEELLEKERRTVGEEEAVRPDYWGAYRVVPDEFEFWQGGRDRLHDRFAYRKVASQWTIDRLMP